MSKKDCNTDNAPRKKDARFRCKKCGAEVMKKDNLCKPEKIK